jgi:hypothetical protein
VILEGVVETVAVTEEIAAAYDSKYDWQPDLGERYLAVRPRRAFAWRERDYPTSATRFDF